MDQSMQWIWNWVGKSNDFINVTIPKSTAIISVFSNKKVAEIYANAYKQNDEFYAFYRSLNAYQNTFGSASDIMVVEPDSDFFDYFKNLKGKQ